MIGTDEEPHDVRVHIRGNHKNLGEVAPRRFLQIVAGEKQASVSEGSGRLQLAEWMVHRENPLTARVMVNRIWKHHFGQGMVRSVDNFGKTGEPPTHPELLDFLAQQFIESGWSIKAMHRLMVLSSTYAMSSQPEPEAEKRDPENKLLHRMPVQRLEAESIRDAILAVSGRLDPKMLGPSVPPHISAHQDGRGKPESGPLDGNGRRSIYIQVRRNFLTPMFMAFDYPLPISAIGRRSVSTVPSQALMLMNNEFVARQAEAWAQRLLKDEIDSEKLVRKMFLTAFGRPANGKRCKTRSALCRSSDRDTRLCSLPCPKHSLRSGFGRMSPMCCSTQQNSSMCGRCTRGRLTTIHRTSLPGVVVLNPLLGGTSAAGAGVGCRSFHRPTPAAEGRHPSGGGD